MHRFTQVNQFLEHSASRTPDKTALIHGDSRLTYGQIDTMADRLANFLLSEGLERGDRVAVYLDNSVEAVISIFGALKAGAAFTIINHTTKAEKLGYILNNCGARAVLTEGGKTGMLNELKCPCVKTLISSGPDSGGQSIPFEEIVSSGKAGTVPARCIDIDLASIIYTSGSTGQPKGVMLSHLNMISAAHSITTYLENTDKDIIINVLPLSFDYGLYQVLMAFAIGGTVILEKSFTYPYKVVEKITRERVTGFPGVPTIFALLLNLKNINSYDFTSLRYITNTAAALPASHIRRLRDLFPQARLYSMYGLTECKRVSYLPPEELDNRPNSIGRGMPNEEVYIIRENGDKAAPGEIGELVIRGSNVMMGYWDLPLETAGCLKPGRYPGEKVLYSGDLFRADDAGYLYFVARKDDIIKCKGEKISPREIENVLYNMPDILEAAVVGVPDDILGQAVKVFVAPESGACITEKEIMSHCARHLENHMLPKYVVIRDTLPKTPSGKINKASLLEQSEIHQARPRTSRQ